MFSPRAVLAVSLSSSESFFLLLAIVVVVVVAAVFFVAGVVAVVLDLAVDGRGRERLGLGAVSVRCPRSTAVAVGHPILP